MIYILHGDDQLSSYTRLNQILASWKNFQKVKLTHENNREDFYLAYGSGDLFEKDKIIICENFLSGKRIDHKDLLGIPKEKVVVFWEKAQLNPKTLSSYARVAKIELFRKAPILFQFLDSISPSQKDFLRNLENVKGEGESSLLWHFTNRILLLIFAKLNLTLGKSAQLTRSYIADWQWSKIQNQSRSFDLPALLSIYSGSLKIDTMVKTGATNLEIPSLLNLLLAKYSRTSAR